MKREEIEDVFGWFGAASHNAQIFEGNLITLLVLVDLNRGKQELVTKAIVDPDDPFSIKSDTEIEADIRAMMLNSERKFESKTLGQLLREVALRDDISELLQSALKRRNGLMHGYFWTNHSRLANASDRAELCADLREAAKLFTQAERALDEPIEHYTALLGAGAPVWRGVVDEEVRIFQAKFS